MRSFYIVPDGFSDVKSFTDGRQRFRLASSTPSGLQTVCRPSSRRFYLFDLGTQNPSEIYITFSVYRTHVIERVVRLSGRGEYPVFGLRYHGGFNYYKIRIDTTCNCIQVPNRSVFREFVRGQGGLFGWSIRLGFSESDDIFKTFHISHEGSYCKILFIYFEVLFSTSRCLECPHIQCLSASDPLGE